MRLTTNLRNLVLSLDLIRMGGKLEGSRTTLTEEVFVPYVNKILDHIQSIEEPVLKVASTTEQLVDLYLNVMGNVEEVGSQLVKMDMIRYHEHHIIAELEKAA